MLRCSESMLRRSICRRRFYNKKISMSIAFIDAFLVDSSLQAYAIRRIKNQRSEGDDNMGSRDYDFTESEKVAIKAAYNWICAACGHDNARDLTADHWLPANKAFGVCLCHYCNTSIKGKKLIPISHMLPPRKPIDATRENYNERRDANQDAFRGWIADNFKGFVKGVKYQTAHIPQFVAPW